MTAEGFEDYAYHIFTEGTQFDQWGSGSERKANSWIGPQFKKACYIEGSTREIFLPLNGSLQPAGVSAMTNSCSSARAYA